MYLFFKPTYHLFFIKKKKSVGRYEGITYLNITSSFGVSDLADLSVTNYNKSPTKFYNIYVLSSDSGVFLTQVETF